MSITPFLWFDDRAEEAARFYVSIFKNSSIDSVSYYGDAGPLPAGTAMTVEFTLDGQEFMALNGGPSGAAHPGAPFQGSIALFVSCATQRELDALWDALLAGGRAVQCGWLVDRYGFAWNLVPQGFGDLIRDPDPARADRAMKAMLAMEKLDIEALRKAADGI